MDIEFVNINDYELFTTLSETNKKARLAVYVKSSLKRKILTSKKTEIICIQVENYEVYCCYRPFKILNTRAEYVADMVEFVRETHSQSKNVVLVGDFNYDFNKIVDASYPENKAFMEWLLLMDSLGAEQIIKSNTWLRTVKGQIRSSLLDHCYTDSQEVRAELRDLMIGDHLAIVISFKSKCLNPNKEKVYRRFWNKYSQHKFEAGLDKEKSKNLKKNQPIIMLFNWPKLC